VSVCQCVSVSVCQCVSEAVLECIHGIYQCMRVCTGVRVYECINV